MESSLKSLRAYSMYMQPFDFAMLFFNLNLNCPIFSVKTLVPDDGMKVC